MGDTLGMEYRNFDINFLADSNPDQFIVSVRGPGGEGNLTFKLPFNTTELENHVLRLSQLISRSGVRKIQLQPRRQRIPQEIGEQLYKALFRGDVLTAYTNSLSKLSEDEGLRIVLRHKDTPFLSNVPWEFLHNGRNFLSLDYTTPIVRYADMPEGEPLTQTVYPLRILVTISNPFGDLDTETEKQKVEKALHDLIADQKVYIDYTPDGTLTGLRKSLESSERLGNSFHIWHFIGHGVFHERDKEGYLAFEKSKSGGERKVSADELNNIFVNYKRKLRLIVLNSCEGARGDQYDPFASIAMSLVALSGPSVIGMQFEFTDGAAAIFSEKFYESIAEEQRIETAITAARQAIHSSDEYSFEWATPVLYTRSHTGRLFEIITKSNSKDYISEMAVNDQEEIAITDLIQPLSWEPDLVKILNESKFWMGTEANEVEYLVKTYNSDWFRHEYPQDQIEEPDFQISKYHITQEQFLLFLKETDKNAPLVPEDKLLHPVTNVSFLDAIEFCIWLSERLGRRFSLPTESQWEKACRGGLVIGGEENPYPKRVYPWGNEKPSAIRCNIQENIQAIGQYPQGRSPYSCEDMVGNVWEWTLTIYDEDLFPYPYVNDERNNIISFPGYRRVIRGGAAQHGFQTMRCSSRHYAEPENGYPDIGFRIVELISNIGDKNE